jgi:hypothetical protein
MTCDVCKEIMAYREITLPDGMEARKYSEPIVNTGMDSVAHTRCVDDYGILEAGEIE